MKKYVVTFLFSPEFELVWLIEKQKPDWQKGCLNGIGGKIEDGETPIACAVRELQEESGISVAESELTDIGEMIGVNNDGGGFQVYIFAGTTTEILKTQEIEVVDLYRVCDVTSLKTIENVPMLIEACIYRLTGHSSFNRIVMHYDKV
jgi:8-oxo-dGTP pyrophosphatase MutT (NUDIX family)